MATILFADSDPHIRLLCRDELQDEGYEVLVAGTGQETIDLMATTDPDVVVMELLLPDMSGLETLKIIKDTRQGTPVIFYSTYSVNYPERGGADLMVLKTHDIGGLKDAVRRLVRPQALARAKNTPTA